MSKNIYLRSPKQGYTSFDIFFSITFDLFADWMTSEGIPYLMLTGSMSSAEREFPVYQFQNDHNYNVFRFPLKLEVQVSILQRLTMFFYWDPGGIHLWNCKQWPVLTE